MVRGQKKINNRSFAVVDKQFVEIMANGTETPWGTVVNDARPVTMAASPQQLLLASGGTAYVFDLVTNTLTAIAGATFSGPVSQAEICDDFFILTIKDSKEFYVSGVLDATDWVSNGSAIVSVYPDNTVGMKVFQRQIWFYSDTQSVVYYDSGNIFPFDVNPNAFIEAGLAAENAVSIFNNSVAWLGLDDRGAGKVWIASGYTPTRISNHAIERAIQSYLKDATIADCVSWTYQEEGHEFLVLQFPQANATWVYDAQLPPEIGWHQRGHFNTATGKQEASLYWNHQFNFGKHLVGAMNSNKIYEMHVPVLTGSTWTFATDDGDLIVRTRRAPHVSKEQKRLYINDLTVYVETGLGPQPPLLDPINPTFAWLADAGGNVWRVSVNDGGLLITTPDVAATPQVLFLNDPSGATSWQVKINNVGVLFTTAAPLGSYPKEYDLISPGGFIWAIKVTPIGILQTIMSGNFFPARAPKMDLRVSKDGAHTWGDIRTRGCGLSGKYRTRVRWTRLGQARDWVFEIQVSDPIGWRVIDGYINQPQEAYS